MRTTRRMNAWQQAQADQGWDWEHTMSPRIVYTFDNLRLSKNDLESFDLDSCFLCRYIILHFLSQQKWLGAFG